MPLLLNTGGVMLMSWLPQLLGVWLEPRVEVVVALNPTGDCVTITVG